MTLIRLVNSPAALSHTHTHTDERFTHGTSIMMFPHTGVEERLVSLISRSETVYPAHGCYLVYDGLQVRDGLKRSLFNIEINTTLQIQTL